MSVALLFPGQGSQRGGMLHALERAPGFERMLRDAQRVLGYDPREFDDEASYRSTVHAQIGLFVCGAICAQVLRERGVRPAVVAGHSVGAFAAACAAGSIDFAKALGVVSLRAREMERRFPSGYGMGVCVGLEETVVREIVRRAPRRVYVANVNAATQTVLAGSLEGIDAALEQCAQRGARRAERLPVAVPSHCELLQPVALALRDALDERSLAAPACMALSGMTGRAMRSAAHVHDDLCDGVAREVRWIEVARLIDELGVTLTIESAPGRVLTDLFDPQSTARHEAMDGMSIDSIVTLALRA